LTLQPCLDPQQLLVMLLAATSPGSPPQLRRPLFLQVAVSGLLPPFPPALRAAADVGCWKRQFRAQACSSSTSSGLHVLIGCFILLKQTLLQLKLLLVLIVRLLVGNRLLQGDKPLLRLTVLAASVVTCQHLALAAAIPI